MKKLSSRVITFAVVTVVAIATIGVYLSVQNESSDDTVPTSETSTTTDQTTKTKASTVPVAVTPPTEKQLVFLIEEEKLAHDVYTVMYQKYGANVFGNILKSESTHQGKVLALLQARSIADPRSSELGVFNNTDLQALYDQLITQGNESATEAYKAGVAIEEKDIADISDMLAVISDEDVVSSLESLRSGSENHLRAFNRQL